VNKRKVIQIVTGGDSDDINFGSVFALCDDGTVWVRVIRDSCFANNNPWILIEDVPQDDNIGGRSAI
jgi:hypothetical protein